MKKNYFKKIFGNELYDSLALLIKTHNENIKEIENFKIKLENENDNILREISNLIAIKNGIKFNYPEIEILLNVFSTILKSEFKNEK
jgi:hypothetical protein